MADLDAAAVEGRTWTITACSECGRKLTATRLCWHCDQRPTGVEVEVQPVDHPREPSPELREKVAEVLWLYPNAPGPLWAGAWANLVRDYPSMASYYLDRADATLAALREERDGER